MNEISERRFLPYHRARPGGEPGHATERDSGPGGDPFCAPAAVGTDTGRRPMPVR